MSRPVSRDHTMPVIKTLLSLYRCYALAIACYLLAGCTAPYTYQLVGDTMDDVGLATKDLNRTNNGVIPQSSSLWVAFPDNSTEARINRQIKDSLHQALAQHFTRVDSAPAPASLPASVKAAKAQGFNFLVYPTLVVHENKVNSIVEADEELEPLDNLGRDKLAIAYVLVDVATETRIDSAVIQLSNGYLNVRAQAPLDLIDDANLRYAKQISP